MIASLLAVVVAEKYVIVFQGDTGYGNYSDSSNTCRAYNDIVLSGIPRENIIYMANEKIHTDPSNPYPGKLFTLPDPEGEGWDHAKDCKEYYDTRVSILFLMLCLQFFHRMKRK